MITAKDAYTIAINNDPKLHTRKVLDCLEIKIKELASEGKYKLITRDYGFGTTAFYCCEKEYPLWAKNVLTELRKHGYNVRVVIEERQFVDIFLEITWEQHNN